MKLLRSITTIGGASVLSQLIGAFSVWLLSHKFDMAAVGLYALSYSLVLIGAQLATFASQLLLPKLEEAELPGNLIFSLLQVWLFPIPYVLVVVCFFSLPLWPLYLLTVTHGLILIAENLALRAGHYQRLGLQRISASAVVLLCLLLATDMAHFYRLWACLLLLVIGGWLWSAFAWSRSMLKEATPHRLLHFFFRHKAHLAGVGSAEVLAMVTANLPTVLINFWFSPLVAGYFAVVNRFCLAPVVIVGNAIRHSIFSRWSEDFRLRRFNGEEFRKVKRLLLAMGSAATLGILICYPLVMKWFFNAEWIASIDTSRYMLPYVFTAVAICPLTVIELVFGSPGYFLRIQLEQLLVVVIAFVLLPWLQQEYELCVLAFSLLTAVRYGFVFLRVNRRAAELQGRMELAQ
ncbi:TPA: lipopolysaccharide biosynthesis protein [Aeromonas veronii]